MTLRNLGFAGAGLLLVGLFTPILSMPVVGNINLFNNGSNLTALILVGLAVLAAFLTARDRLPDLVWPGAGAAAILAFVFARLQYRLSAMRESVAKDLEGNPFAGIAQTAIGSIQIQWGWLILAAGAGLLLYVGAMARKEAGRSSTAIDGSAGRIAASASAVAVVAAIALEMVGNQAGTVTPVAKAASEEAQLSDNLTVATDAAEGPTAEEAAYIRQSLRLYDLDAKYFDSILDARVPGVRFKLQNNGNRTLNEVRVRVVFYDGAGKAIAEEEYSPVLVSEYNIAGDNDPLRPNYIWQGDSDEFFAAKNVPSEWATGKATASVIDIEFNSEK